MNYFIRLPALRNLILLLTLLCYAGCNSDSTTNTATPEDGESRTTEELVYITPSGKKYHQSGCNYLTQTPKAILLSKADQSGYLPCKVCYPVQRSTSAPAYSGSTQETSKQQCKGITRKGTRCKRKTNNSSGYCFQHQ